MRKTKRQMELIACLDRLIYLGATGTPAELAEKLEISTGSLFQVIKVLKDLKAPIVFDIAMQSYVYEETLNFTYGFCTKNVSGKEILEVSSCGMQNKVSPIEFKYPMLRIVK